MKSYTPGELKMFRHTQVIINRLTPNKVSRIRVQRRWYRAFCHAISHCQRRDRPQGRFYEHRVANKYARAHHYDVIIRRLA